MSKLTKRQRYRQKRRQLRSNDQWTNATVYRDLWSLILDYLDPELFVMYGSCCRTWKHALKNEMEAFKTDACSQFCRIICEKQYISLLEWGIRRWHDFFFHLCGPLSDLVCISKAKLKDLHFYWCAYQQENELFPLVHGDWPAMDAHGRRKVRVDLLWQQLLYLQKPDSFPLQQVDLQLAERKEFFEQTRKMRLMVDSSSMTNQVFWIWTDRFQCWRSIFAERIVYRDFSIEDSDEDEIPELVSNFED
jgi:hypothetical protein